MEIFGRRFDDLAQRRASNECVRLIRKLRWIGMDDEAERVLAQLSGWPFRPTETVIAGPWATDYHGDGAGDSLPSDPGSPRKFFHTVGDNRS